MNKTIHNWILAGAIFLSFSAGYVNAISISHQTPLTHATGSLSQVALNLENGDFTRSNGYFARSKRLFAHSKLLQSLRRFPQTLLCKHQEGFAQELKDLSESSLG